MYCPQCATENPDKASFCRGCGANISLVPQALTGSQPAPTQPEWTEHFNRRRQRKELPNVEKGIKNVFMGVAFILAAFGALSFAPNGRNWWFWLFIPAFAMLGGGVAEMVRYRMRKTSALPDAAISPEMPAPGQRPAALPRRDTSELMQPPSVTEGTTRHLETPVESRRKKL